ncbi:Zinc finger MYM-type protein 1 [Linum grandiflorum]
MNSSVETPSFALVERDPGLRKPIWTYPHNKRDEIRRAYLRAGPQQIRIPNFPKSGPATHLRSFQASWYSEFDWLEYSESKDAAYCLFCYLFAEKPSAKFRQDAFTSEGFRSWKKVKSGVNCSFRGHMGKGPNSIHNNAMRMSDTLMHQSEHIDKILQKQTSEEVQKNIVRVNASISAARWLTLQGLPFRGNDEGTSSGNRGNFIELLKHTASYNKEVAGVILENAPKNAKYTSPDIQKEIVHVIGGMVRKQIFEEIGDSKFSIIVDEASDESFVDIKGLIQERLFDVVHVKNTTSMTLYSSICSTLSSHKFAIQNIRGQGYDGTSNMRGEWNGLKALFLNEYPQAYYVHCEFFLNLSLIVNAVTASCKRYDEFRAAQANEIASKLALDELESGTGSNQISTLPRACDTRWSSHLNSISSLIRLYDSTYTVLENIKKDGSGYKAKGDASVALRRMTSFEFIFILLLMKEILGITDTLCQALQLKAQDIVNAMSLVAATIDLLQKLREQDWDSFFTDVLKFCKTYDIEVPNLSGPHVEGRTRQKNAVTNEHYYHFDVFNTIIDYQIEEIRSRFDEKVVELLKLSSCLDPSDGYKAIDIDAICTLAKKYYPLDFSEQEIEILEFQLRLYQVDVPNHPSLKKLSSVAELCYSLTETGKSSQFYLVDRLIRLILTLPVSTATGERVFSAMKIVQTRLRSKMHDEFLADSLVIYVERDISKTFSLDAILSNFSDVKERRVQLK